MRDLWQTFIRRRRWVLASVVVCVLAGIVYVVVKGPVYEARAVLRIGQAADSGLLESPEIVSLRALAKYGKKASEGVERERPYLTRVGALRGSTDVVEFIAEGDSPDDAAMLLERATSEVRKSHEETLRRNLGPMTLRVEEIGKERGVLQRQYEEAGTLIAELRTVDAAQASVAVLERGRIATLMTELESQRLGLAQRIVPPKSKATELVGEIVPPTERSAPKVTLVLTLAAAFGLVAGAIIALFVDFVVKVRS